MSGLGRVDIIRMVGVGLIALAALLVIPAAGFGPGDAHDPGAETARLLASGNSAWVASAISAGVVLVIVSWLLARRE
jgi:hypothetical protein